MKEQWQAIQKWCVRKCIKSTQNRKRKKSGFGSELYEKREKSASFHWPVQGSCPTAAVCTNSHHAQPAENCCKMELCGQPLSSFYTHGFPGGGAGGQARGPFPSVPPHFFHKVSNKKLCILFPKEQLGLTHLKNLQGYSCRVHAKNIVFGKKKIKTIWMGEPLVFCRKTTNCWSTKNVDRPHQILDPPLFVPAQSDYTPVSCQSYCCQALV